MTAEKFFLDVREVHQDAARIRRNVEGIMPGDNWQDQVQDALRYSRCLIALCSPTYFHSRWCHLEMSTFLSRQRSSNTTLITPVSLRPKHMLPDSFRGMTQVFEVEDYVIIGESFEGSRLYPDFTRYMNQIAKAVARTVCAAPAFQPWPTVETDPSLPRPGSPPKVVPARF